MSDGKRSAVTEKTSRLPENEATTAERGNNGSPSDGGETADLDQTLEQELERLREQIQEQQRIAAEAQDNFLRARADFENYRRRMRQDMEDARRFGVEGLVTNLLPVLDDLERALEAAQTTQNADALLEGVSMIHTKLQDVLGKVGVEPIEAVGQPFNAEVHEAIMQVEAEEGQPPNTVAEELRRGYKLHDRVLRASLVKVAS